MNAYDITSQYYDAMANDQLVAVREKIAAAMQGVDCSQGPIIDIGAGTGLTTQVIARALPTAEILAIEPHAGMRAALMTRVCADPDLQRRVTILPMGIFEAPLPAIISGAVASAVLVHFDALERARLWQLLRSRLAPGGRVVTDIQCPEAVDLPETRMASSRVGHIEYEGYAQAMAIPPSRQRWRMTYRALLDGAEIERRVAEFVCHAASAGEIAKEATEAGFEVQAQPDLVTMIRGVFDE
jgi:trans-aconitate methyltransferase